MSSSARECRAVELVGGRRCCAARRSPFRHDDVRARYLPDLFSGRKVGAYALSEPGAGSDAGSLKTAARRDGDAYVIDGAKTFITNAPIAEVFVVFANASPPRGSKGITAFVVDREAKGLEIGPNDEKMACTDRRPRSCSQRLRVKSRARRSDGTDSDRAPDARFGAWARRASVGAPPQRPSNVHRTREGPRAVREADRATRPPMDARGRRDRDPRARLMVYSRVARRSRRAHHGRASMAKSSRPRCRTRRRRACRSTVHGYMREHGSSGRIARPYHSYLRGHQRVPACHRGRSISGTQVCDRRSVDTERSGDKPPPRPQPENVTNRLC